MNRSAVLQRDLRHDYPCAVAADGNYIIDAEGKRYFDASAGAAISCLGHCNHEVIAALQEQVERLDFAHTAFFTNNAVEELATFLCSRAPQGLSHAYFSCGGSEAMEAAFKIAHQYFQEKGEGNQRRWIITRERSYHGNTLGSLSFASNNERRKPYQAILLQQTTVSACDTYRGRGKGESDEEYSERLARELDDKIKKLGAENVIAFAAETISGSTIGAMPPSANYWKRMREVCEQNSILLILDEVMCGAGRSGYLFACSEDEIAPDILAMSKGLGGGVQPIGATLVSEKIVDTLTNGSGILRHGHSFMSHPVICATALAVQKIIEQQNLLEKVRRDGAMLQQKLENALQQRSILKKHIGDLRGRGLLRAVEIVENIEEKKSFPAKLAIYKRVRSQAMANGLICYPSSGNADGESGDHVLLAPPFTISEQEMNLLVETLYDSIQQVLLEL